MSTTTVYQIAIQLYTLRDFIKTPQELSNTLRKVRRMGYTAIQKGGTCPVPESDFLKIVTDEGLTVCATHEPGLDIRQRPEEVLQRVKTLGCRYVSYAWPGEINFRNFSEIEALARDLEISGSILRKEGITLCYHHHAIEFLRHGSSTVLEYLFDHTHPQHLQAEIDTYWIQFGGADPVAWCQKMKGRLPLLHLKDYKMTYDHKPTFAEVGSGTLDWFHILPAAKASGCEWFTVEQDSCEGDPFACLERSLQYLKKNFPLANVTEATH